MVFIEDDGEGGAGASSSNGGNGGAPGVTVSNSSVSSTSSTVTTVGVGGGGPGLVEEVVQEGVTGGTIALDALPDTLGITALATADDPFAEISFPSVTAPSGSVVVSGVVPSNTYEWLWYGALGIETPQIEHPETFPLAQGPWTFGFESSSPMRVGLWRRSTIDGQFHGGVLDVNVYSPEGLISENDTLDKLAIAFDDWGGIELGNVAFYTVPEEFFVVNDDNLFLYLDETKVAQTRPALNLMATALIEGSLEGAAGFSVGIPGVGMWHGTNSSGVFWMPSGEDYDPIIMRHEAGHFGGLFHTTEFVPGFGDPLSDTPQCADIKGLGQSCPDWNYIMHPAGGSGAGLISQQEARVLQGGSLYRGVYAPGEQPMVPYGPPLDGSEVQGKRASARDLEQARANANARGRHPIQHGTWAARVSPAIAMSLAGVGCPLGSGADYFTELASMGLAGAKGRVTLLAIAQDDTAPPFVQRRALLLLGRLLEAEPDAASELALEAITRDPSRAELTRQGALRALERASIVDAQRLALDLRDDADLLVRRTARALQ